MSDQSITQMGVHVVLSLFECPKQLLTRVDPVKTILLDTVAESNLHLLSHAFHQFEPHGVTGFALLAESHISVHTWPEHNSVAIDIFCCYLSETAREDAKKKALCAAALLEKKFEAKSAKQQLLER